MGERLGAGSDPLLASGAVFAERYRLVEEIGRGGMGVVYRACHDGLHKDVALKVLRDELITDRQAMARFHQEAVAAATIGHSGIASVSDYGFADDGRAFLVMEYLEGRDLAALIAERGALTAEHAVTLARKILAPLGAAHARGIVHRDLKTQNIFLVRDEEGGEQIKLLDFGISKVVGDGVDAETGLTTQGAILGTPKYLAPEQAQGEKVDARSDLYALGIVLYEMLTGSVPFRGDSPLTVLYAHVQQEPESPRRRRPDLGISRALEAVVLRALAKDPAQRYPDAEAMAAALAEVDPSTQRLMATQRYPRQRRRSSVLVLALGAVALAGAAAAYALWPGTPAEVSTPVGAATIVGQERPARQDAAPPNARKKERSAVESTATLPAKSKGKPATRPAVKKAQKVPRKSKDSAKKKKASPKGTADLEQNPYGT